MSAAASITATAAAYALNCYFGNPSTAGNKAPKGDHGNQPSPLYAGHQVAIRNWSGPGNVVLEDHLKVSPTEASGGTFTINILCGVPSAAMSEFSVQLFTNTAAATLDDVFAKYALGGLVGASQDFPTGNTTLTLGPYPAADQPPIRAWTPAPVQGAGSEPQTVQMCPAITLTFQDPPQVGVSVYITVYVTLNQIGNNNTAYNFFDDPKMEVTSGTGSK
jgi:hypothetical protein